MGVDKEYIIEHCQDKQRLYGIDICMLQTEPCKRAVEQNRCPKIWWEKGADDYERAIEQTEHDMLYEPTYNSEDGSM